MALLKNILSAVSPAALAYNTIPGKRQDSTAAANQYLNQIPGMAKEQLSPYIMPGQGSIDFINQIMQSYKPSEGYNFKKAELGKELGNTAAAGGYAGGEYHQKQMGDLIQRLLSGDMQQYLQNVVGAHNQSYNASSNLTDILGGGLNQQGGLAFSGAESKNAERAALQNAIMQIIGQGIGASAGYAGSSNIASAIRGQGQGQGGGNMYAGAMMPQASGGTQPGAGWRGVPYAY